MKKYNLTALMALSFIVSATQTLGSENFFDKDKSAAAPSAPAVEESKALPSTASLSDLALAVDGDSCEEETKKSVRFLEKMAGADGETRENLLRRLNGLRPLPAKTSMHPSLPH